jgi:hypothetical protein
MISGVAQDCITLIYQKLSKEISLQEYRERLKELALRYPNFDFHLNGKIHKEQKGMVHLDRKTMSTGEREPGEEG